MKIADIIVTGTIALTIAGSTAFAQQSPTGESRTGTVIGINRLNSTIAVRQTQGGTVGANAGSATEEFKLQDGALLNALHAGDKVTFSATGTGGMKTITKLEKQ